MAGRRTDDPNASMQTWGVPDGGRVWVGGNHVAARAAVESFLTNTVKPPEGPLDRAFVTPLSVAEGVYFAGKLLARLLPDGMVWVVIPRSGSLEVGSFQGTRDELSLGMFERGFMERGAATISDEFISIGFVRDTGLM